MLIPTNKKREQKGTKLCVAIFYEDVKVYLHNCVTLIIYFINGFCVSVFCGQKALNGF